MNKDVKNIGLLMLVLFMIGIIVGVTYIGFGYLKETSCEQAYDGYDWYNETCYTEDTNHNVTATVTAVTKIGVVEDVLEIVLGLLALVVVVAIFVIVIKAARSMGGGKDF